MQTHGTKVLARADDDAHVATREFAALDRAIDKARVKNKCRSSRLKYENDRAALVIRAAVSARLT